MCMARSRLSVHDVGPKQAAQEGPYALEGRPQHRVPLRGKNTPRVHRRVLMLSNLIDAIAIAAFTLGIYELAGRGWALIAAAFLLVIVGIAVEGLNPIKLAMTAQHDLRAKIKLKRVERQARRTRQAS